MEKREELKIVSDLLGRNKLKIFNEHLKQGEDALGQNESDMATAQFGCALAVAYVMVRPKTRFANSTLIRVLIQIAQRFQDMGDHETVLNCLQNIAQLFKHKKDYPDKKELVALYRNATSLCAILQQQARPPLRLVKPSEA